MQIRKTKKIKKIIIITIAIIIVLLAATATAYHYKLGPFVSHKNNSINLNPPTSEQKAAGNDVKQNTLNQTKDGKGNTGSDPSPAPQPVAGSDKKSVGMDITATNQTDTALQIRTFIQTVTNSGTCSLSMKNSQGLLYTATTGVQAQSSTTTCKGFDVPIAQLSSGVWTISISFSNDSLTASTNGEVTIK